VVGLANTTIQTFDVRTGARTRPLKGHTAGVWAVCLIEPGGHWAGGLEGEDADEPVQSPWYESQGLGVLENPRPCPPRTSDSACTSEGWGQTNTLVVTGGCDKDVRVWELPSG
jgi:F-box and WD-40 domain protein CDC4